MKKEINTELISRQTDIFMRYLDGCNISSDNEEVAVVLNNIKGGKITTLHEKTIQLKDGGTKTIRFLEMKNGVFTDDPWSGWTSKSVDHELVKALVTLGFTINVYDRGVVTKNQFTAIFRGDGLPKQSA